MAASVVVAPLLILFSAVAVVYPVPAAAAAVKGAPGPAAPGNANITKILSRYPEFSLFSGMLAETGLASAIGELPVVTVLAINNTAVTDVVRRLPRPFLADLLALHVVLDYLDPEKLDALRRGRTGNGSVVATILQGTRARFLRVAGGDDGRITFSYAGPGGGGPRNATLVRVVTAQAYSVLVLQVSGLVLPAAVPAINAAPIDISEILNGYPEFIMFSSLATQTGVARAINAGPVVTVLAVRNKALSRDLKGLPILRRQLLADLLALHAVLDFLDAEKLDALRRGRTGNGSVVPTLLQQATGNERGRGALRVSGGEDGRITFSSTTAAPGGGVGGAPRNATLVRVVTAQANTVMILEVSGLVVPPGIARPPPPSRHTSLPPSPKPAPAPQHPPASAPALPPAPSPISPAPNSPPGAGIIPLPSVHGGVAAKVLPSASSAGRGAESRRGAAATGVALLEIVMATSMIMLASLH